MLKFDKLKELLEEKDYDAFLATKVENVFYLTNFWGEGMVLFTKDSTILFTYNLERDRALSSSKNCDVISVDRGIRIYDEIAKLSSGKKIFIDDAKSSIIKALKDKALDINLEPSLIYEVRRYKEDFEIDRIKRAGKVLDELYDYSTKILRESVRERELLAELVRETFYRGCETSHPLSSLSPFIVAFGENSAYPHAQVSDRRLRRGDVIVLDLFIRYEGYTCDCTRTFVLGRANEEFKEIYTLVKEAQRRGFEELKEGVEARAVDEASRRIIKEAGYGKYYVHGLGHGVGLEVHEPPVLNPSSKDVIENREVVTIEPGVYLNKKFGIRIEDTVVLKDGEKMVFNNFTKELLEL
ncbi:MAG: aminopeptidase P family protein [Nitrososphaerales archaeon]